MQFSFVVSLALHAAVLVVAIVGLPSPEKYEVQVAESIPVEILTVADLTRLQAQKKDAKPTEKPAPKTEPDKAAERPAPKQEQVAALPPEPAPPEPAPEPEREAVTPPAPAPKRETLKAKDEPEPEPMPEPEEKERAPEELEAKPVPKPRKKPPPPKVVVAEAKNEFDADQIAALLNKIPEKNQRRIDPAPSPDSSPAPGELASLRGDDLTVTLDEKDALRQQVERCWVPPVGARGADDLLITVRIRLKPDGTLQTPPELLNSGSNQYFRVAAESAMRAVRRCEPYSMPPEKYQAWREIILNFDPSHMFRG